MASGENEDSFAYTQRTVKRMDTCKILAVEDTDFARQFLSLSLRNEKCELYFANNGAECLDMLAADQTFSFILMDIETPVITGLEACRVIRETFLPPASKIPIIAVTAHHQQEYQEQLLAQGFDQCLIKPYKKDDLLAIIDKFRPKESAYDLSMLRDWASGDEHMIEELITVFVKDAPHKLTMLREACTSRDWTEVRNIAHSFAPQLSFVGLEESYNETSKIETLAAENIGTELIAPLLSHVESQCGSAIDALRKDFKL